MWFYRIFYKVKRPVFESYILPCQALAVDRDGRPDQWSIDRTGRRMCTRHAQRPVCLVGRPSGRPTEVSPLSGWPGRPAREPLLSGSGPGRPGGRPAGSTVKNLTVGQSTGQSTRRSFLTFLPANGQNFVGGYKYPTFELFSTSFQEPKFWSSLVWLESFMHHFLPPCYVLSE